MGFYTCNYYRFLDLVYKLSVSGEISKRLDSTGKTILLLNKFSGLIIWGVALYMLKQVIYSYRTKENCMLLKTSCNSLTNYEVGSGFCFTVFASFAGLIQMIAMIAPMAAKILVK